MIRNTTLSLVGTFFLVASNAFGQAKYAERQEIDGKPPEVYGAWDLTMTPAKEAVPALRYSLLPRYWDRRNGDATAHYYRALLMDAELPVQFTKDYAEKSEKWLGDQVDDAVREEMRKWVHAQRHIFQELQTAAYCERLELDLRFRDLQGIDAISFLLPDVQRMRSLARMLAIKARLEIADGKLDEAINTLTVGYRLAHAAAKTPTMVNGLVGVAIAQIMTHELTRFIASPDAPNMYWAITSLPRPLIDVRAGMEHEYGIPAQIFPFLRDAETATRSADEWRRLMLDAYLRLQELSGDYLGKPGPLSQVAATGMMMRGYPFAKQFLIVSGMARDKVEAMPVGQVLAVYTARTHRYVYDEMFKWTFLPPSQIHEGWEATQKRLQEQGLFGPQGAPKETLPIASILLPAVQNVWHAPLRLERQLAALRVIEAIRMYAAQHGGEFPKSLDDIHEGAIPLDPMFDKPFPYRVSGDSAVLEIPPRPHLQPEQDAYRFVIRFKKP